MFFKKKKRNVKMSKFLEDVAYSVSNEDKDLELSRESDEKKAIVIEKNDFVINNSPFSMDDLDDYDPYKEFDGDE